MIINHNDYQCRSLKCKFFHDGHEDKIHLDKAYWALNFAYIALGHAEFLVVVIECFEALLADDIQR